MNGFFQTNTYYNEFKQEPGTAYVPAPIQQQNQQQQQQQQEQQQQQQQQSHQQQQPPPPPPPPQLVIGADGIDPSLPLSRQAKALGLTKNQQRFLYESEEARAKRLARNAERMREKRATETEEQSRKRMAENAERMRKKRASETEEEYRQRMERNAAFKLTEEYQRRLAENAERNRRRRQNETDLEKSIRRARSAARERLRRAMETPEQRAIRLAKLAERMRITRDRLWRTIETPEQRAERLAKLAERMRIARANETPEQRELRLAKNAARARQRFLNESPEQWIERKRKKAEYARQKRAAALTGPNDGAVPSTSSTTSSSQSLGTTMPPHQQQVLNAPNFPGQAPATLPETILHTTGPLASGSSSSSIPISTYLMSLKDNGKHQASTKSQPPAGSLQAPAEQVYPPPQVLFGGAEFKPHELLNGQHLVMQSDPNCPNNLYKLHILPYPFSSSGGGTGGATHLDQSTTTYKNK